MSTHDICDCCHQSTNANQHTRFSLCTSSSLAFLIISATYESGVPADINVDDAVDTFVLAKTRIQKITKPQTHHKKAREVTYFAERAAKTRRARLWMQPEIRLGRNRPDLPRVGEHQAAVAADGAM